MRSSIALFLALALPPGGEGIYWYHDAETALAAAGKSGRPIVLLKIRADIGPEVKT